jgi:hypothetical protein
MSLGEPVITTPENRGEVETKTVNPKYFRKIRQAFNNELSHTRVFDIQRITAPGVINVLTRCVRRRPIVGEVIDSAKRDAGPKRTAFGRVVVGDIEDDFQSRVVKRSNHVAQFDVSILVGIP